MEHCLTLLDITSFSNINAGQSESSAHLWTLQTPPEGESEHCHLLFSCVGIMEDHLHVCPVNIIRMWVVFPLMFS